MGQGKENDRPTVYLKKSSYNQWSITNKEGREIITPRMFHNSHDAIEWAKITISSWPTWNLVINEEQKD